MLVAPSVAMIPQLDRRVRMSPGSGVPEHLQRLLRLLTIGDEPTIESALHGPDVAMLDHKTSALVTIAALVATEADGPSYQSAIDHAHVAGAEDEEILQTLVAIAPLVGSVRIASAVPELTVALGEGHLPGLGRSGSTEGPA
jgi:alkylhydroperoxidase/carboxymuconolactone decarboxylase family protein YurZ